MATENSEHSPRTPEHAFKSITVNGSDSALCFEKRVLRAAAARRTFLKPDAPFRTLSRIMGSTEFRIFDQVMDLVNDDDLPPNDPDSVKGKDA